MSSAWSRLRAVGLFAFSAFAFAAVSRARFIVSWNVSASARVGTTRPAPPAAFSSGATIFLVLAPPKLLASRDADVRLLERADVVGAVAAHERVLPCCFSRFRTRSLSSGLMRAKMATESRKSHRPARGAANASEVQRLAGDAQRVRLRQRWNLLAVGGSGISASASPSPGPSSPGQGQTRGRDPRRRRVRARRVRSRLRREHRRFSSPAAMPTSFARAAR